MLDYEKLRERNLKMLGDDNYIHLCHLIYDINTYSNKHYETEWIRPNKYKVFNSKMVLYGSYNKLMAFLDTIINGLNTKMSKFIYKNKKCYIASVSLLDGEIEEYYSFKEFFYSNCHHAQVFSKPQVEKIESYENACFIIVDGLPTSYRYIKLPNTIVNRIREQIEII